MTDYETQLRDEIYKDALRQTFSEAMKCVQAEEAAREVIRYSIWFANTAMQARKESKQ